MTKDLKLAALAGLLTGLCLIPTVINIGIDHILLLVLLPLVCLVAITFGVWLGKELARYIRVIFQISKFAAVGFLNTAIDFGILNLFSLMTGVTSGIMAGGINVPGTIIAASNSYVWNKLWVFQKVDKKGFFRDVPKFVLVTILGLISRSLVIALFTSLVQPMFGFSPQVWLNIGKILATLIGILVDFLGYKFLVFRKN